MPENEGKKIKRIFAPTPEDIRESRNRIREIVRRTSGRYHPFTREDFEVVLRSATKPLGKEQTEKESAKT